MRRLAGVWLGIREQAAAINADAHRTGQPRDEPPFFDATDWRSFGMAAGIVFVVYLCTLAPDVTLEFSGIMATGAYYAGVPHPPGYPLWVILGWLFTHLVPIGGVAWRLAVFSAICGALACGCIALMVSRSSAMVLDKPVPAASASLRDATRLRIACGCIAGGLFGFSNGFWAKAVIVDSWPLSVLLFCVMLCLFMPWVFRPHRQGLLYAAFFVYGLTLTNSQAFCVIAPALPFLVSLGNVHIGRNVFLICTAIFLYGLNLNHQGYSPSFRPFGSLVGTRLTVCLIIGGLMTLSGFVLCVITRDFWSQWKATALCALLFLAGFSLYLYLPLASMSNPPVNWGYARTVEGMFHTWTRGQYEPLRPTGDLVILSKQLGHYVIITGQNFGWLEALVGILPLCLFSRMTPAHRKWMWGLICLFLSLSLLMVAILNPPADRQTSAGIQGFYAASHVVLAIWAGMGLTWCAVALLKKEGQPTSAAESAVP